MTAIADHAAWCNVPDKPHFCGSGTDCFGSVEGEDIAEVYLAYASAVARRRRSGLAVQWEVKLGRNFSGKTHEEGADDRYLISLVTHEIDNDGTADTKETDLCISEAREIARRLLVACDAADADAAAVAGVQ